MPSPTLGPDPTLEQITRELVLQLQTLLGSFGDCLYGGKRPIEVVSPVDGTPIQEIENKPKLSVTGPEAVYTVTTRRPRGVRAMTSNNHSTYVFSDTPFPGYYSLFFDLLGYATRDVSSSTSKGILWLQSVLTPFLEGGRLLGSDWTSEEENFIGYYYEHLAPPQVTSQVIGGGVANLFTLKARMRIIGVRLSFGPDASGPTTSAVDLDTGVDERDAGQTDPVDTAGRPNDQGPDR